MIDFHDLTVERFANNMNKMKKNAYVMQTDETKSKRLAVHGRQLAGQGMMNRERDNVLIVTLCVVWCTALR